MLKINKMQYEKLSEHVGKFPLVLIAPNDTEIIHDGSEFRGSFFDGFMSQLDQHYLQSLIRYNHFLQQRNSLLKQFAEKNYIAQIKKDTARMQDFLKLLGQYNQKIFDHSRNVKPLKILSCIDGVINGYQFTDEKQRSLIHVNRSFDFEFLVD